MDLEIREARQKGWFFMDNIFVDSFAKKLKTSGIVVYMSLCRHADNKTQECFPTIEGIAKQHGISKSTVIRAIKRLEEFNLIHVEREVIERENGVQKKNRYTLLDKNVWQGVTNETLPKTTKQGVKRDKSRVSPEYYKETHINKTHIPVEEKTVSVAIAPEEFSLSKALDGIRNGEDRDMKVIGLYIVQKKIELDNRAQFSKLVARCKGQINTYKKKYKLHPFEGVKGTDIKLAMQVAEKKYEGKWTFETVMNRLVELAKGI